MSPVPLSLSPLCEALKQKYPDLAASLKAPTCMLVC